jgi:hypothetical protein
MACILGGFWLNGKKFQRYTDRGSEDVSRNMGWMVWANWCSYFEVAPKSDVTTVTPRQFLAFSLGIHRIWMGSLFGKKPQEDIGRILGYNS